jgi:hypothetical protein
MADSRFLASQFRGLEAAQRDLAEAMAFSHRWPQEEFNRCIVSLALKVQEAAQALGAAFCRRIDCAMNLRHVAALALVGWYLLMPPMTPDRHFNTFGPLSKWSVAKAFDTAGECNNFKSDALMESMTKKVAIGVEGYSASQCIASDDPRLKGN